MATTKSEIQSWFDRGVEQGATHMAVVCDTFDWEDYPHSIMPGGDPLDYKPGSMQKVMEVYALHLPKDPQLGHWRNFNYEMPTSTSERSEAALPNPPVTG